MIPASNNTAKKIMQSVSSATGLRCLYQSEQAINVMLDNADMPCAFAFLLQSNGMNTASGNYRERVTIAVFFVDLTNYDFNSIENEDIISRCKSAAVDWLAALQTSHFFRLISVNSTQRVYDRFDAIVTGFAVNVTIEEVEGVCK